VVQAAEWGETLPDMVTPLDECPGSLQGGVTGCFELFLRRLSIGGPLRDLDGLPAGRLGEFVPDAQAARDGIQACLTAAELAAVS
jgi:hypothetical protein